MQRVRIGLTGLAFVFLAVLLAAVFAPRRPVEEPLTRNLVEQHVGPPPAAPNGIEAQPTEPLAKMGVAPGHTEVNTVAAPD